MKEWEGTWRRFQFNKLLYRKSIILKTKLYLNRKGTGLLAPPRSGLASHSQTQKEK
jgi:hypothetical protein